MATFPFSSRSMRISLPIRDGNTIAWALARQVLWYMGCNIRVVSLTEGSCDGDHARWRVLCGPSAGSAGVLSRGGHPVLLALAVPEGQIWGSHLWPRCQAGRDSPL